MRIIRFGSLTPTPWKNGGGVTRQIACDPPEGGLEGFVWRISSAEVATDGPFSSFDGVDRRLYLLDGAGLDLRFADGTRRLRRGQHIDFSGEAEVFGALVDGPVSDLNIMVRRGRVKMRAAQIHVGPAQQSIGHGGGAAALFVLDGVLATPAGTAHRLDTLLADTPGPLQARGPAEVLLIGFEALG